MAGYLTWILSSALQCLSEGLAHYAMFGGGCVCCVTWGDKAHCWMYGVVPVPNAAGSCPAQPVQTVFVCGHSQCGTACA